VARRRETHLHLYIWTPLPGPHQDTPHCAGTAQLPQQHTHSAAGTTPPPHHATTLDRCRQRPTYVVCSTLNQSIKILTKPHTHGQGEADPSTATVSSKPCITNVVPCTLRLLGVTPRCGAQHPVLVVAGYNTRTTGL